MISGESISYTQLPGKGWRSGMVQIIGSPCTLWLGPDHLLSVETVGYTESYRRFYLKDIQAIQVCPTQAHVMVNALLVMLLFAVSPLLLLFGGTGVFLAIVWFGALIGAFHRNRMLGPACRVVIRTAVQTDQLPALSRLKFARQALEWITPMIEAAQGGAVAPEEARARLAEYQRRMLHVAFAPQGQPEPHYPQSPPLQPGAPSPPVQPPPSQGTAPDSDSSPRWPESSS